jgi:hypothetical protein
MTRPRVVSRRDERTDGSVDARLAVVPVWPAAAKAPVAGALSRYCLLLPAGRSSPVSASPPPWGSPPERAVVR